MTAKQSYSITTRRLRIRCKHPEWLKQTQDFYNQIEKFYYSLFLDHPGVYDLGSQKALRELELLSLPGRDKRTPECPLPWEKVPLYFRRSAANAGIAAAKSHLSRKNPSLVKQALELKSGVVYYKGMYKDFTSREITLKVWTGSEWKWMRCRLYGKEFPENAQIMSPSVIFEYEFLMLHVPIKEAAGDAASVKERMAEGRNICSLQFTNGDAFAVGCITDGEGRELAVRFFKGGKDYRRQCGEVMEKIRHSRQSMGLTDDSDDMQKTAEHPNQKHWMHLKRLNDHYAHAVSRKIVDFCEEYHASVIAVPKYDPTYSYHVMVGCGNYSPLHLSTGIRQKLSYKAWKSGIIVIEVYAKGISSVCALCGGRITAADKKNGEYFCENGHRGSRHLNTARNLSRKCRQQFKKQVQ